MTAHLSLQLSHCSREIEHQPGDVLQLALQDLDGIRLLLVLKYVQLLSCSSVIECTPIFLFTFQAVWLGVYLYELTCS